MVQPVYWKLQWGRQGSLPCATYKALKTNKTFAMKYAGVHTLSSTVKKQWIDTYYHNREIETLLLNTLLKKRAV